MILIKKLWKYSTLRFYILNAISNYSFWLFCTKEYKIIQYIVPPATINSTPQKVTKKIFVGYKFKNKIFMDNPGLLIRERDVWKAWKKKGLIK